MLLFFARRPNLGDTRHYDQSCIVFRNPLHFAADGIDFFRCRYTGLDDRRSLRTAKFCSTLVGVRSKSLITGAKRPRDY